jgi:hypothetical protein
MFLGISKDIWWTIIQIAIFSIAVYIIVWAVYNGKKILKEQNKLDIHEFSEIK